MVLRTARRVLQIGLKNLFSAGSTVSYERETTWKTVVQQQGTHSELYFVFCFVLILCPGVKCEHGGITFQTPFTFITAKLLLQPKETSLETSKFNLRINFQLNELCYRIDQLMQFLCLSQSLYGNKKHCGRVSSSSCL
jgi:hypothetical protein